MRELKTPEMQKEEDVMAVFHKQMEFYDQLDKLEKEGVIEIKDKKKVWEVKESPEQEKDKVVIV